MNSPVTHLDPATSVDTTRELTVLAQHAIPTLESLFGEARAAVSAKVTEDGRVSPQAVEAHQFECHGLAWLATYLEAFKQMVLWAENLGAQDQFGETERLIFGIALGEYTAQIFGGIPMSQTEIIRLSDLGIDAPEQYLTAELQGLINTGNTAKARQALVTLMQDLGATPSVGALGLDDEYDLIRDQFRRFAEDKVVPHAHEWHLKDELIPIELIEEMGELGVFGLTIPEEYGGFGMSKTAMCVVSEELSRGYIGVGSLGTRSEIAAELILCGGTEEQKQSWLPRISSAKILPTAVFTEPNTGSDLGSLRTRAEKSGETYTITGNKTWITHAARADVMTLLARTDPETTNHTGLSMFLAEKPRGAEADPFPADGMTGGEIEVLGYRGMKEYELGFDGFTVAKENLLGGQEGQGFRQLMQTFESARIQTAARAVGVAQNALETSLSYAVDRKQFGKSIVNFPRVASKLALMAAEIMVARQLTYYSAREKDEGRRCDLEAGMAKLLGARVAWSSADNGLQIHGGNGFALEYPISRILCDARILNIFEGAAEIQAQVIARRLLEPPRN